MSEIKVIINEQLQQLQLLMYRVSFHDFMGGGWHNPHRGQGRVLAILKLKPEISQKELGYLLDMSKQSLAELLAKLERNGYITREPSEEDKRVMTIRLTEKGRKAAEGVDNDSLETTKLLDCLNEEELASFSDYLGRIIRRYEERFPGEDFEQRRRSIEEFMSQHGHGFAGHGYHHGQGYEGYGHHSVEWGGGPFGKGHHHDGD